MSAHGEWAARGYAGALLPIVPPNVRISSNSAISPDARGKVPGVLGRSGGWVGYAGWRGRESTADDLAAWAEMGAGVGLQAARFPAVDIDVMDGGVATAIEELALRVLGVAPVRFGRAPKRLLAYRSEAVLTKRRVEFALAGVKHAVEFLGDGQQYVVEGIHAGTGRPYEWPRGVLGAGALTEIRLETVDAFFAELDSLLDMFGAVEVVRQSGGAAERVGIDQAALLAPSESALVEALEALPNDGTREGWIKVGHAIKAAGGSLDQWASWSAKAAVEDDDDLVRRWGGFEAPFAIGWSWIEERARGAGWLGSALLDFGGVEAPIVEPGGKPKGEAEAETLQDAMFRDWRWIEAVKRYGHVPTGTLLDREQFNVRLARIGAPHDSRKCASAQFLSDERLVRLDGLTYKPGGTREVDEDGLGRCFNQWRPGSLVFGVGVKDTDIRPWLDVVEFVIPDVVARGHFLDWMACVIQRPDVKINFAPVLGSDAEGMGKNLIVLPLEAALGAHNHTTVGVNDLESAQNDWCARVRLVSVNEMYSSSRKALGEGLKQHIAAPPDTIRINGKHIPQYDQPNRHCMLFYTNKRDALAVAAKDRRYFVIWADWQPKPEVWYSERTEWLKKAGGHGLVAGWLMARDISHFNHMGKAPFTEAKGEMVLASMSDLEAALHDGLEDWPDLVSAKDIAVRVNAGHHGRPFTPKAVNTALRAMGSQRVHFGDPVILQDGSKARLLSLRNHDAYDGVPSVALGRQYAEGWASKGGDSLSDFKPDLKIIKQTSEDLL